MMCKIQNENIVAIILRSNVGAIKACPPGHINIPKKKKNKHKYFTKNWIELKCFFSSALRLIELSPSLDSITFNNNFFFIYIYLWFTVSHMPRTKHVFSFSNFPKINKTTQRKIQKKIWLNLFHSIRSSIQKLIFRGCCSCCWYLMWELRKYSGRTLSVN